MEVVKPPNDAKEIVGKSGKVYRPTEAISGKRFDRLTKARLRLLTGDDPKDFQKSIVSIFNHANHKTEGIGKIAVIAHNLIEKIASINDDRIHPMMEVALMFWNAEGEATGDINDEMVEAKRRDLDHIDANFFFIQAARCMPDWQSVLETASRIISQIPKQ